MTGVLLAALYSPVWASGIVSPDNFALADAKVKVKELFGELFEEE